MARPRKQAVIHTHDQGILDARKTADGIKLALTTYNDRITPEAKTHLIFSYHLLLSLHTASHDPKKLV